MLIDCALLLYAPTTCLLSWWIPGRRLGLMVDIDSPALPRNPRGPAWGKSRVHQQTGRTVVVIITPFFIHFVTTDDGQDFCFCRRSM